MKFFAASRMGLLALSALWLAGMAATVQAQDTDGYKEANEVDFPTNRLTCAYSSAATTINFSFDISWIDQARGEYFLADQNNGFPVDNNEGGLLSSSNSGDLLLIHTDNPSAGPTFILPPRGDPFAGFRCDSNASFGGNTSYTEISGPNGVFTVNDTQVWAGDGPSRFTPGQTNSASDYRDDPCDSSVRVFDLATQKQIAHINVHGCFRTDEGAFDPVHQVVLFANPSEQAVIVPMDRHAHAVNRSPFITLISTMPEDRQPGDWGDDQVSDRDRTGQQEFRILKQINFDGSNNTINAASIEQSVYARQTGLFYISVPANTMSGPGADGYVTVVDPRPGHLDVVGNYPLASGTCPGGPAGAALGPRHELLLGCGGGGGMVVVDIGDQYGSTAALAASTAAPIILPDGSQGCDEVAYDAASGHFGGACGTAASLAQGIFGATIDDAHKRNFDIFFPGSPFSAAIAHSIAADSVNGQFWMPLYGSLCKGGQGCVAVYSGDDSDAQGD